MSIDSYKLAEAEWKLARLAEKATEAPTKLIARTLIGKLIETATIYHDVIENFEPSPTPEGVARDILVFVTKDTRILMGTPPEQIDPTDRYSKRLEVRQRNLPQVLSILDAY